MWAILNSIPLYQVEFVLKYKDINGFRPLNGVSFEPRTYPPHFGLRLVRLYPHLIQSRSEPPEIPLELASVATQDFFDSLSWDGDLWEDGQMFSVLSYARGNEALDLGPWRSSFPSTIWPIQNEEWSKLHIASGLYHWPTWVAKVEIQNSGLLSLVASTGPSDGVTKWMCFFWLL